MKIRVLLAACIVVAAAAAGALYAGHRATAPTQTGLVFNVATTGNLGSLFPASDDDAQLIGIALSRLESDYYKPVDPQTPFKGETQALLAYLKSRHINATLPSQHATGDPERDAAGLEAELAYARSHYGSALGPAGDSSLVEYALDGIMGSVDDPYTVYLSPREIRQLDESLAGGDFGGIGVYIYPLKGGDIFIQPIEAMPAARAGMKPFEILDAVDHTTIHGLSPDRVQDIIRGPAGTIVTIVAHPFQTPKKKRTYHIVRQIIHVPTVYAKMENGFDYVRLSEFGQTSAQELRTALLNGQAHGAKGYILDLRDNGGGLVDAAVAIVSYFVEAGKPIVSEIDRSGQADVQRADGNLIPGLHPVVVLVNKYTASASEITAGALQDYRLATILGTQTFGKGVVQSIYPMPDSGALKITTARYVTPLGRDIQHRGIHPDIVIDQSPDPSLIDTPADKQLAAAKARLRQLLRPTLRS